MKHKRQSRIFIAVILLVGYLGIYDNSLAIFHSNRAKPSITSRSVTLYPENDRKALENGIPFSNPVELSRLMEDFLS